MRNANCILVVEKSVKSVAQKEKEKKKGLVGFRQISSSQTVYE